MDSLSTCIYRQLIYTTNTINTTHSLNSHQRHSSDIHNYFHYLRRVHKDLTLNLWQFTCSFSSSSAPLQNGFWGILICNQVGANQLYLEASFRCETWRVTMLLFHVYPDWVFGVGVVGVDKTIKNLSSHIAKFSSTELRKNREKDKEEGEESALLWAGIPLVLITCNVLQLPSPHSGDSRC